MVTNTPCPRSASRLRHAAQQSRSWTSALVRLAIACAVLGGCGSTASNDVDERLVRRNHTDGWLEVDTTTEAGRAAIADELQTARAKVMPMLAGKPYVQEGDRPASRPASRPSKPLPAWTGPRLAIVFQETPLREVVASVAAEMKANVIVPTGLTEPVTVNFPDVDPMFGLDTVLRQHGHRLSFENDVLTVVDVDRQTETRTWVVRSNRVFDPEKLIKPLLSAGAVIVNDEAGHRFTVTDTTDALSRVEEFMQTADSRAPQVLIEAIVVEVRRERNSGHGAVSDSGQIDLGSYDGIVQSTLPSISPDGPAPFKFGITNANNLLSVLLSGYKGKTKLNVLSNPIVATISGEEAKIDVVQRIPYIKSQNTIDVGGGNAATSSSSEIEYEEIGIKLKVTPEVGADRVVKMKVEPETRELVDFRLGVPVIDDRKVTSNVLVQNNETLVIGGLYRTAKRFKEQKAPVLGDIPIIGDIFFTREDDAEERIELLIFVTPHLMGFGAQPLEGYQPQRDLLGPQHRFERTTKELDAHTGLPTDIRGG